ncbi:MAG: Aspartyl/glutamyl-tRNA(Asn/Gln) amidotransferase subunit B [Phycisphaerae bacterium]|nr:Aspartyl/glutamyl-tRNA(Asn/Gln) amidotransferase subunit B [Phycisphaerae bacterium]
MSAFRFKPYTEMTSEDYAAIELKCGLEVHRQLLTRRKLFCRCPAGRYSKEYHAEVLRHMRPTLSELGEYDGTALMEKKTRKNIYYRLNQQTVCTYEMDDTPPFFMDDEALDIALELCLLLKLNIVGELHIARKQYLDGSIPTGFQRTAIVGVDGELFYQGRRIGVRQLSIEEDSCREVTDIGHDRVYLTDRLGMPLIEVVTEPEMYTPQEVAEVGEIIRLLCHSTRHVRVGSGAARQDVNVSVRGGTRVEIKGTPQIWRNPHLIYNEAMRQCALLHIRDLLRERGVTSETLQTSVAEVTRTVANTAYVPIRKAVEDGLLVKAIALKHFEGLLNHPTQEHTTFAKEFSDRVRVIACLTQLPNIAHSDLAAETLSSREWREVRRKMRADADDALLLVWGNEADTVTAAQEIILRAREATIGVPSDTRQAYKDGTNGFERVLPGPERMYPDTDLPPIEINSARLERLAVQIPRRVWELDERLQEIRGLAPQLRQQLLRSPYGELFCRIMTSGSLSPNWLAVVLTESLIGLRREGCELQFLSEPLLTEVFTAVVQQRLVPEGVMPMLRYFCRSIETLTPVELVNKAIYELRLNLIPIDQVRESVVRAVAELPIELFVQPDDLPRYLMGRLMEQWRGRLPGRQLAQLVREQLTGHAGIQHKWKNYSWAMIP